MLNVTLANESKQSRKDLIIFPLFLIYEYTKEIVYESSVIFNYLQQSQLHNLNLLSTQHLPKYITPNQIDISITSKYPRSFNTPTSILYW